MKPRKQTVHQKPRCSVTKLGEYVAKQSSPARRQQIVQAQKVPPTFQVVTYTPASNIIVDHIVAGKDESNLIEAIGDFFQKMEESDKFEKQQAKLCHEALKAYRKIEGQLDLADCAVMHGPRSWAMEIAGVTVSIRPELLLRISGRGGAHKVGLVKFYFSKTHRLDEHAAGVISAVILAKAEEELREETKISRQHVFVVDVFGGKTYKPPTATKRLFNEAKAACAEIAIFWPNLPAS